MKRHKITISMEEKDIMTMCSYKLHWNRFNEGKLCEEEIETMRQLEKESEDIAGDYLWPLAYACTKDVEHRLLGKAVHDFMEERATSEEEENEEGGS